MTKSEAWRGRCGFGLLLIVLLTLWSGLLPAERAFAHASLIRAVPEPNGRVAEPPGSIVLSFNERLERELYYIKIFDEIGRPAAKEEASLSADQRELALALPELSDGLYTVTYHVISADGHPIRGTYVLVVGDQPGRGDPAARESSLHEGHAIGADMSAETMLQFLSRMLYYVSLVSVLGWVIWGAFLRAARGDPAERHRRWSVSFQRAHLLLLAVMIGTHYRELLGDLGWERLPALFTGTRIGLYWLISLALSFLGFVLLHRRAWLDLAWAAGLTAAKSASGHAVAIAPALLGAGLDAVHLAAAAVWAGGLWQLVLYWKQEKAFAERLLPRFSTVALASLALLAVTGAAGTLLILPSPRYLLYSQWGIVLLVKLGLVLLVTAAAGFIRAAMRRKREDRLRRWLKADFGLMAAVALTVGMLTYVSPVPPNEPLYWHEMGETIHMTTKISPNVPGVDNSFSVQVWLADSKAPPKQVILKLTALERPELAPIEVPLQPDATAEADSYFVGADQMSQYTYRHTGPLLPYPGEWTVEVRVMDRMDDETVYRREIRLY